MISSARRSLPLFVTAAIFVTLFAAAGMMYDGFFSTRVFVNLFTDTAVTGIITSPALTAGLVADQPNDVAGGFARRLAVVDHDCLLKPPPERGADRTAGPKPRWRRGRR